MKKTEPKATADGIPVYCSFDELVDTEKLVPNPKNPNSHPDRQLALLAKVIKHQGWRAPITVSTRSGFIVRGHGRILAAQMLDVSQVPVDYQGYATEAEEYADLIADNRLAELAEMKMPELKDLLQELDTGEIDLDLTGFLQPEIEELMLQYRFDGGEFLDEDDEKKKKQATCPECGAVFDV